MSEQIPKPEDILIESSTSYLNEIAKIKRSTQSPEIKLDMLNLLVKDYLRKKYHMKRNSEYSELINYFLDKKKPHIATFCHEMVEALYGGDDTTEGKIQLIIDDAKSMLAKEFDIKESEIEKTSIKDILLPFTKEKKKDSPLIDTQHISKQTKQTIDKYLNENEKMVKDSPEINPDSEEKEEMDSLKSKLKLSNKNELDSSSLVDNPEKIQNIGDLERIKNRIRIRKMDNY